MEQCRMMRWEHCGFKTCQMTGYSFFGLLEGESVWVKSWRLPKPFWGCFRAMELGRELFELWGYVCIIINIWSWKRHGTLYNCFKSYRRCDELIWVKTNQLQRLIRTGRTGHWLNHGKEHCLVWLRKIFLAHLSSLSDPWQRMVILIYPGLGFGIPNTSTLL